MNRQGFVGARHVSPEKSANSISKNFQDSTKDFVGVQHVEPEKQDNLFTKTFRILQKLFEIKVLFAGKADAL